MAGACRRAARFRDSSRADRTPGAARGGTGFAASDAMGWTGAATGGLRRVPLPACQLAAPARRGPAPAAEARSARSPVKDTPMARARVRPALRLRTGSGRTRLRPSTLPPRPTPVARDPVRPESSWSSSRAAGISSAPGRWESARSSGMCTSRAISQASYEPSRRWSTDERTSRPPGDRRPSALRCRSAPVAQWIEHLTSDQTVGGSNPSGRAIVLSRDIGDT